MKNYWENMSEIEYFTHGKNEGLTIKTMNTGEIMVGNKTYKSKNQAIFFYRLKKLFKMKQFTLAFAIVLPTMVGLFSLAVILSEMSSTGILTMPI